MGLEGGEDNNRTGAGAGQGRGGGRRARNFPEEEVVGLCDKGGRRGKTLTQGILSELGLKDE